MNKICETYGHFYETFIIAVGNKHVYDFAGEIRICKNCHKKLIKVNGVWQEAFNDQPRKRIAKPVDENQISLFE